MDVRKLKTVNVGVVTVMGEFSVREVRVIGRFMNRVLEKVLAFSEAVSETYHEDGLPSALVGIGLFLPVVAVEFSLKFKPSRPE
ncbi:hypothetical protein [Halorussus salinisoli]|uniref:hypothetical protein n=1 Tax=Halorussus salinisoli TaxID=2558242 RepID=UPI0010C200FB|nr:hypothetical protein [Halorussus salinisoli]